MSYLSYFASDFGEASRKFCLARANRDATLQIHEHPLGTAFGQRLAVHVARLGAMDARRVLVVVSGTHGVEGFLGSAAQSAFASRAAVPHGTAVLLIHGLNPYGFAGWRRVTEGNVDLNRNFIDFSVSPPANEDYGRIAAALCPADLAGPGRAAADAQLTAFLQAYGKGRLQEVITRGQYTHPDGLFYGGAQAVWSRRTFERIIAEHLSCAERIGVLDIHTGLGAYATLQIISEVGTSTAAQWFGSRHLVDAQDDDSVSSRRVGSMLSSVPALVPDAQVVGVALEFGTEQPMEMLNGLREEAWLYAHGDGDLQRYASVRRRLRDLFYPQDAVWQEATCRAAVETMSLALGSLSRSEHVRAPVL